MTKELRDEIVEYFEARRVADIGTAGKEYNKKLDRMISAVKSMDIQVPDGRAFCDYND